MNDSTILEARELVFMKRVRPRSSKIWHLSDELFTEVVKAFVAGNSFAKIRKILGDAGVPECDLPSQPAWAKFWSKFRPFLRLARREAAADGANVSAAEARKSPADFDEACLDLARQLTFEIADSDAADPKEVTMLIGLLLRHKDQRLRERLVEVAEQRLALAKQRQPEPERGKPNGTTLTTEEWEQRAREIFGIGSWEGVRSRESGGFNIKSEPEGAANIQHPTSNIQHPTLNA